MTDTQPASHPPLRKLGPAIDRLFRFVEMVGVVALLRVVVLPAFPQIGFHLTLAGSALATYYLLEPVIDSIVEPRLRYARTLPRFLGGVGATALVTFLVLWPITAAVAMLATLIGNVID